MVTEDWVCPDCGDTVPTGMLCSQCVNAELDEKVFRLVELKLKMEGRADHSGTVATAQNTSVEEE